MACSNLTNCNFFQQTCIAFCTNNEVLIALPPAAVAVCALLNFFSTPSEVVETESFSNFSNFQSQSIGVLTSRDASDVLTKCQKCHILNDAIKIFCAKKIRNVSLLISDIRRADT